MSVSLRFLRAFLNDFGSVYETERVLESLNEILSPFIIFVYEVDIKRFVWRKEVLPRVMFLK